MDSGTLSRCPRPYFRCCPTARGASRTAVAGLDSAVWLAYFIGMSSRKPKPAEYRWKIIRLRSTPAADLGTVTAPDEESAIEKLANFASRGGRVMTRMFGQTPCGSIRNHQRRFQVFIFRASYEILS